MILLDFSEFPEFLRWMDPEKIQFFDFYFNLRVILNNGSILCRYDMCRRRKGGRCTKGTAGKWLKIITDLGFVCLILPFFRLLTLSQWSVHKGLCLLIRLILDVTMQICSNNLLIIFIFRDTPSLYFYKRAQGKNFKLNI